MTPEERRIRDHLSRAARALQTGTCMECGVRIGGPVGTEAAESARQLLEAGMTIKLYCKECEPVAERKQCPICDEWYDPAGDRASVHEHPEPQSGPFRDAWLASKLSYPVWAATTPQGRQWRTQGLAGASEGVGMVSRSFPSISCMIEFRLQRYDLAIMCSLVVKETGRMPETREEVLQTAERFLWLNGYSYPNILAEAFTVALQRVDHLFPELVG